jgi:hypothetical protein
MASRAEKCHPRLNIVTIDEYFLVYDHFSMDHRLECDLDFLRPLSGQLAFNATLSECTWRQASPRHYPVDCCLVSLVLSLSAANHFDRFVWVVPPRKEELPDLCSTCGDLFRHSCDSDDPFGNSLTSNSVLADTDAA